jgi:hypothetical protein
VSQLKLSIESVIVHQPGIGSQNPNALRRSLEANLVRDLARIRVSGSREAKVLQARFPAMRATASIGNAVSQAIAQALEKSR